MNKKSDPREDAKVKALRANGALHSHPEQIQDEVFRQHEFFDPRDRVQLKYEMVRRHRIDGKSVTETAGSFGVSRQAFYITEAAFNAQGLPGLLPHRRGPQRAHKLTDKILDFVEEWLAQKPPQERQSAEGAVKRRFGIAVHPRSIERALARRKKKLQDKRKRKP